MAIGGAVGVVGALTAGAFAALGWLRSRRVADDRVDAPALAAVPAVETDSESADDAEAGILAG